VTALETWIRRTLREVRVVRRLSALYWKARFRILRPFDSSWKQSAPDGLPVPPQELRFLVGGPNLSVPEFLEMGGLCARRIEESLSRHGGDMRTFEAVLDFGSGCGRTIRHFAHLENARLHGTDYNPVLVEWCRRNLTFATFGLNQLHPPLDHADQTFDLIYAFSVFTHLTEAVQHLWMREFTRLLKPDGFLVLSTMPEHHLSVFSEAARDRFRSGRLVVLNAVDAGQNSCVVFHPYSYVKETLAAGFEVLEFIPDGVWQDMWLLRKRPEAAT
jgi:SAM-dependent methyltransferase